MSAREWTLLVVLAALALAMAGQSMAQPMSGAGAMPMHMHSMPQEMQGMHESHAGVGGGTNSMHNRMSSGHRGDMLGQAMPMWPSGASEHLAGLEGEEFEVAFMSMMVAHHQGAIELVEPDALS